MAADKQDFIDFRLPLNFCQGHTKKVPVEFLFCVTKSHQRIWTCVPSRKKKKEKKKRHISQQCTINVDHLLP